MKTIIFLHGLLGEGADWQKIFENLPRFQCIAIDLPFHGSAKNVAIKDFAQASAYLHKQIQSAVGRGEFFLVGYSLGGRLALDYALRYQPTNLQGLILEGVNLGLQTEAERKTREQNDEYWARRFETESFPQVLEDWYQQPVFSHLNAKQRAELIALRGRGEGKSVAKMLRATSLAKQPNFLPRLPELVCPFHYFVGEFDQKFRQLTAEAGISSIVISQAGHNTHQENPTEFTRCLMQIIK